MEENEKKAQLVKNLSKDLKILLVDDDFTLQLVVLEMLKLICDNIITAEDGQEGFEKALSEKPDLIVTDIQMPRLNGLEMAKKLADENCDIPIIVLTAHDDSRYLLESVNASNIYKYLKKPLFHDDLIAALFDLIKSNVVKKQKEKIPLALSSDMGTQQCSLIAELTNMHPDPMIYIENNKIVYGNDAFYQITSNFELKDLSLKSLDVLLSKEEGYLYSLSDIDKNNYLLNKIKIKTVYGIKIFFVLCKEHTPHNDLYIFHDITYIEYQKHKKLIQKNILKKSADLPPFSPPKEPSALKGPSTQVPETERVQLQKTQTLTDPDANLDNFERILLRKTRHQKRLSSLEYLEEIEEDVLMEIQELAEIEQELDDLLYILDGSDLTGEILEKMSLYLASYSKSMKRLLHFQDLAYSLDYFSKILFQIGNTLVESNKKIFKITLIGIISDIKAWRNAIFIQQNAIDIHYLDASLFSSMLQAKRLLEPPAAKEADEDDFFLELF